MGDVQGPNKLNNTCVKTMHAGTIDRGFTVEDRKFQFLDFSFSTLASGTVVIKVPTSFTMSVCA
jgi:hypothetical protein